MKILILALFMFSPSVWCSTNAKSATLDYSMCFEDNPSKENHDAISAWLNFQKTSSEDDKNLLISQCALSIKDYNKSKLFVELVLIKNPNNIDALKIKARILIHNNELKAAEDILSWIYDHKETDLNDVILLSDLLYKMNNIEKSIKILDEQLIEKIKRPIVVNKEIVRVSIDEIDIYMKKSQIQYESGDKSNSINTLKFGFSRNNGSVELFDTLLFVLTDIKDNESIAIYLTENCDEPLISLSRYCQDRKMEVNNGI